MEDPDRDLLRRLHGELTKVIQSQGRDLEAADRVIEVMRLTHDLTQEILSDEAFMAQLRQVLQTPMKPARKRKGEPVPGPPPQDELIPIRRVAAVLNLHPATVRAMSKRGDFPPAHALGARKLLFSRRALDAWYATRDGAHGNKFPIE